jgi:hypothetical protein
MIVRYQVVNPGPFLFHCHIHTDMVNGMAVALLDGIVLMSILRSLRVSARAPDLGLIARANARLDCLSTRCSGNESFHF